MIENFSWQGASNNNFNANRAIHSISLLCSLRSNPPTEDRQLANPPVDRECGQLIWNNLFIPDSIQVQRDLSSSH